MAAANGDTRCLRVFHECGFLLSYFTWTEAVEYGHGNCLEFAVSHGYKLSDILVRDAVRNGRLGSVDFLLQRGLLPKPYMHYAYPTGPGQLECIQLMLDKGAAVHPKTLIMAARGGDLDFVPWLHQRGVPLWDQAQDVRFFEPEPLSEDPLYPPRSAVCKHLDEVVWRSQNENRPGTLYIPWDPHALLWKVLS